MKQRLLALAVAFLVTQAVGEVFASGSTGYVDTGYGYSWGYTFTLIRGSGCGWASYWCGYGKTYNYNYSYQTTAAYYLQTGSAGWNCDLGCHCVDRAFGSPVYNNYVSTGPKVLTWDDEGGPAPSMWVTTVHVIFKQ